MAIEDVPPTTDMIGQIHAKGVKLYGGVWFKANEDAVSTVIRYAARFRRDQHARFVISDPLIKEMVALLVLRAMRHADLVKQQPTPKAPESEGSHA